jgi:hypothetical protein
MRSFIANYLAPYGTLLLGLLLVGATVFGIYSAYTRTPAPAQLTTQSPKVSQLETKAITPKQVVVIETKAKAKLNLPKPVQADTKQHVVSASKVDYSLVPKTVTTVFDEDTGQFTTYQQDEQRPWVSTRDSGYATLAYGFKGSERIARLSAHQSLLQIKAVSLGATGHLDSDGDHFIGLGATYRW